MRNSAIIPPVNAKQRKEIIFQPPAERIIGRTIADWTGHAGTYGMGGPGFFGLKLAASVELDPQQYREEWLILCLWGSVDWLVVNGRWLASNLEQHGEQRPLTSFYGGENTWDEFGPLVIGHRIGAFDLTERSTRIQVEDTLIELTEDPASRPVWQGTKKPRVLDPQDHLRDAWILAPWPWVQI